MTCLSEKQIEQRLVKAVRSAGGLAPKFISPGWDGVPDRIVLMPEGHIAFVEVKRPGAKPRALQLYRHKQLRHLGFEVFVLDSPDAIPEIIERIKHADND